MHAPLKLQTRTGNLSDYHIDQLELLLTGSLQQAEKLKIVLILSSASYSVSIVSSFVCTIKYKKLKILSNTQICFKLAAFVNANFG
jgi:hypothetical protein